jgi:heme/copper-type cytochrome/quinol oxidase subunit 1
MFTLVRRFIKTGIGFLFAGLALGAVLLVRRELFGLWPHQHLVSAHTHAVFVGFVMFLICGVALWLFPRAPKDDTGYRPERVAASYWILTVATASRFTAEAARAWSDAPALRYVVVAGGLAQVLGLAVYFRAMWSRIRPVGSHLREAQGEKF